MNRQVLFRALRILITAGLLVFVAVQSGLFSTAGRQAFLDVIKDASLFFLVASFLVKPLGDFASAVKWYYLALALRIPSRLWQMFSWYMMGRFFNLVLPSNIGGDLVRVHLHSRASGQTAHCAAAVFMERFTGLVVLVLLASFAILWHGRGLGQGAMLIGLLATIGGTVLIAVLLFGAGPYRWLLTFSQRRLPALLPIVRKIGKFRKGVTEYGRDWRVLFRAFVHSLWFYALSVWRVWLLVLTFDQSASLYAVTIAVPLILIIMNLPISIGGIGLMEFGFTLLLGAMGIAPEVALAAALLMRIQSFFFAGVGGVLYAFGNDRAAHALVHAPPAGSVGPASRQESDADVARETDLKTNVPVKASSS